MCDLCVLEALLRELADDLSLAVEREEWDWGVGGEDGCESAREVVGVGGVVPSVTGVVLGREGVSPEKLRGGQHGQGVRRVSHTQRYHGGTITVELLRIATRR